jgi:hypothetical protein
MTVELLSLRGVRFEVQPSVVPSAPTRADIALFVGYVARRPGPVPEPLRRWFGERGWLRGPYARPEDVDVLFDVPVPVESWESFDALFAWERRGVVGGGTAATYLGAAVRSFFAQGGRQCYVVRVGDPLPVGTPRESRVLRVNQVVGRREGVQSSADDRAGWGGLLHLYGLPEVSFVCAPDLPDLLGADPQPVPPPPLPPPLLPVFETCSMVEPADVVETEAPSLGVARMALREYTEWARVINGIAQLLRGSSRQAQWLREVQLIAAVPLPTRDQPIVSGVLELLARAEFLNTPLDGGREPTGLGSSFVQLVYPWATTPGSTALPEGIEPPDGILAGVIARVTLLEGAYRTAAGASVDEVSKLSPQLTGADLAVDDGSNRHLTVLPDRVSTLWQATSGFEVLSDVTPSLHETYRPAAVHRLVSMVLRAVRRMGETLVWQPSGEQLWREMRRRIEAMLETLWAMGALNGATSSDAYTVRCDRSTMTDADQENGRLILIVSFTASAPIERITVTLAMDESGQVQMVEPIGAAA